MNTVFMPPHFCAAEDEDDCMYLFGMYEVENLDAIDETATKANPPRRRMSILSSDSIPGASCHNRFLTA